MTNLAQRNYKRYPKSARGTPEEVAKWEQLVCNGPLGLNNDERFWRDVQPFLLERGYRLRPRYSPDWVPSWLGTDIRPSYLEDSLPLLLPKVIDARRADDTVVAIKWIPDAEHTRHELDVLRFLSADEMRRDPRNHCAPLLDTFGHPTIAAGVFVVSPWLSPLEFWAPRYVNDLADLMLQCFEGLSFLHSHGVAHRDCTTSNIMIDCQSLYPNIRLHPQNYRTTEDMYYLGSPLRRCQGRARYYYIDFGISSHFPAGTEGPRLVVGDIGRDQTVPELSDTEPYDPFKLDVYVLGNFFLEIYISKYKNVDFLRPVLEAMVRAAPQERPSIDEALAQLKAATQKRNGLAFRWRLRPRADGPIWAAFRDCASLAEELYYWARVPFRGFRELSFGRPESTLART